MSRRNKDKRRERKSPSVTTAATTAFLADHANNPNDGGRAQEKAAFVEAFISHCRNKHGMTGLVYDPDEFGLKDAKPHGYKMSLWNCYADYCAASPNARESVIDGYASAWHAGLSMPSSFSEAKERLYPVIRNRWHDGILLLEASRGSGSKPLTRPITDNLVVDIVCDNPTLVQYVDLPTVEGWGVDADAVFQSAMENLRNLFVKRAMKGGAVPLGDCFASLVSLRDLGFAEYKACNGLFTQTEHDWFSPSRILLPEWIRTVPTEGDPIALIPHSGALFITGSNNVRGLQAMAKIANDLRENGHPVSSIPIRLTAGGWRTYQPEPSHPASSEFRELYSLEMERCYGDQQKALAERFTGFVASCFLLEAKGMKATACAWAKGVSDGLLPRTATLCLWAEGLSDVLLPRTDYVVFQAVSIEDGTSDIVPPFVPWDAVLDIVGHRMELTEYSPPRFRIRTFPSDDEIAQLVARGIPMRRRQAN